MAGIVRTGRTVLVRGRETEGAYRKRAHQWRCIEAPAPFSSGRMPPTQPSQPHPPDGCRALSFRLVHLQVGAQPPRGFRYNGTLHLASNSLRPGATWNASSRGRAVQCLSVAVYGRSPDSRPGRWGYVESTPYPCPKKRNKSPGIALDDTWCLSIEPCPLPLAAAPRKRFPVFLMTASIGDGKIAVPAHAGTGSRYTRQNQGSGNPSVPVYDDG